MKCIGCNHALKKEEDSYCDWCLNGLQKMKGGWGSWLLEGYHGELNDWLAELRLDSSALGREYKNITGWYWWNE